MYNPFSLIGKTILVTGASSGIGRATAIECSKMGATLILTARNEMRLQETLEQLEGTGHQYIVADLSSEEGIKALVEQLPQLSGVVHCAGVLGLCPVQLINAAKLEEMQHINLNAPILLTQLLVKRKKLLNPSSVVFIASVAGVHRVSVGNAIYATTKSGIDAFMRSCALELASKGIRFNSVNPAMIETDALKDIAIDATQHENNMAQFPLKRYGRPEEVAYAVIYLLSDASGWLTGTAIKMDGGLTLS